MKRITPAILLLVSVSSATAEDSLPCNALPERDIRTSLGRPEWPVFPKTVWEGALSQLVQCLREHELCVIAYDHGKGAVKEWHASNSTYAQLPKRLTEHEEVILAASQGAEQDVSACVVGMNGFSHAVPWLVDGWILSGGTVKKKLGAELTEGAADFRNAFTPRAAATAMRRANASIIRKWARGELE